MPGLDVPSPARSERLDGAGEQHAGQEGPSGAPGSGGGSCHPDPCWPCDLGHPSPPTVQEWVSWTQTSKNRFPRVRQESGAAPGLPGVRAAWGYMRGNGVGSPRHSECGASSVGSGTLLAGVARAVALGNVGVPHSPGAQSPQHTEAQRPKTAVGATGPPSPLSPIEAHDSYGLQKRAWRQGTEPSDPLTSHPTPAQDPDRPLCAGLMESAAAPGSPRPGAARCLRSGLPSSGPRGTLACPPSPCPSNPTAGLPVTFGYGREETSFFPHPVNSLK